MLSAGTRLGQYEIRQSIGAGGMGEVYLARDAKLQRDVAIKVLPEQFAHDPDRLARFRREAQLLASLNHPNIATIHGLEDANGSHFLVMEYVPGETLADVIRGSRNPSRDREGAVTHSKTPQPPADARGSDGLPLEDALAITTQICDALEHAHEKGIIHRDLKPANVKLTPEGKVKALDFGLAKAFAVDSSPDLPLDSNSPTVAPLPRSPIGSPQAPGASPTMPGVILGTAAYMSPEQAKGKVVDKRTDIWALGCVLYELLAGRQAFSGETVTEVIASVLKSDPDWSALPDSTPSAIRGVLRRCLTKDVQQRPKDAGDIRIQLNEGRPSSSASTTQTVTVQRAPVLSQVWLIVGALACLVIGALAGVAIFSKPPITQPKPVSRFAITLPPGDRVATNGQGPALDISSDGRRLVYAAFRSGMQQLYVREMNNLEPQPIRGSEGAALNPIFSPDGRWIAFMVLPKLMKVPDSGGSPQTLTEVFTDGGGATWAGNNTIVFGPTGLTFAETISASGGTASQLTTLKGDVGHRWPQMLPGGKAVIFTNWITSGDTSQIVLERIDTHEHRIVIQGGTFPRYIPTGHLLFMRGADLMAVPFDVGQLEVTGQPVSVLEGVIQTSAGAGHFSVSDSGTLVYLPGGVQGVERTLAWVDRKGTEQPIAAPPRSYVQPKLSPDGKQLAINVDSNVWVYDLERGTLTRLTFEGGNGRPLWTPDGKRVAYLSTKGGTPNLWWKPADGTGSDEQLTHSDSFFLPGSISPDLTAIYVENHPGTNRDIYVVSLNGDRKQRPWLQTNADETYPQFSPDGKWVAYSSNESGRFEIYVRPASGTGGKWPISIDGGVAQVWNPSGKELFFQNGDKMYAVDIRTEPTFSAGTPHLLFEGNYEKQAGAGANYNVSPDGQRFLMIKPGGVRQEGVNQINVVLNWFEELKQKVPAK